MIGLNNETGEEIDPILFFGWHKRFMTENLLYTDGHADSTLAAGRTQVVDEAADAANICDTSNMTSRGPTWQLDVYPTPGRHLRSVNGQVITGGACWPFQPGASP
jgi:hypothetical protein